MITFIGSAFFKEEEVPNEIVAHVSNSINHEAGKQVEVLLGNVLEMPDGFRWILIGILVIIKSATIIFFIMQKALNAVWKVKVKSNIS